MLTFLNLLKERKLQSGTLLIILCMLLLTLLQAYTLYEICRNTYKESKEILYNTLLTKTAQSNATKSQSASFAVFSYDYSKNKVDIKKGQTVDTTIHLNEKMDIRLLRCKGYYDARDTSLWSLDALGKLLKTTFKDQAFIPPFTLSLTDKDGETLDTYKYDMLSLPIWTFRFEIPLGFLEHHQLSAELIYPLSHFWDEIWDKVITTLSLTILFIISIRSLLKQLKKEKRQRQYLKDSTKRMVHNLRSPMMYIKQLLPTLIGSDPIEQKEIIDECQDRIISMLENTNILLSESMNAHKLKAHKELYGVDKIINKVGKENQNSYEDKHISITVDNRLTEDMYIDPIQIEAALGNLVDNSIKYSGPAPRININCWIKNNSLMISVEDNGIGIPKSEQKNIFRKEYRIKSKEDSIQPKGHGIGLYDVKTIALAHKGNVSVESDGESGSTFTIEIPQKKMK